MHVAIVSPYPLTEEAARGGVEESASRLVAELRTQGLKVTVVAPGTTRSDDVVGVEMPQRLLLLRLFHPWRRSVLKRLHELAPDIVHGQGLLAGGLAAADWQGVSVVTAHGNPSQDALIGLGYLHGVPRALVSRELARAVSRRVHAVLSVHPNWRHNLPSRPKSFLYVPNIVAEPFYLVPRAEESGRVLFCGGSRAIKGWNTLASAWPLVLMQCPNACLHVVGWQDERPEALPNVEVSRTLTSPELALAMSRASALALPSLFEVAPMAMAEAWAARLPVVASRVGGIPEMAGDAAALVPPQRPKILAAAIVEALEGGSLVRRRVADGATRAEEHRSQEVGTRHVAIYRRLTGGS